jgi:hypothetical protein
MSLRNLSWLPIGLHDIVSQRQSSKNGVFWASMETCANLNAEDTLLSQKWISEDNHSLKETSISFCFTVNHSVGWRSISHFSRERVNFTLTSYAALQNVCSPWMFDPTVSGNMCHALCDRFWRLQIFRIQTCFKTCHKRLLFESDKPPIHWKIKHAKTLYWNTLKILP